MAQTSSFLHIFIDRVTVLELLPTDSNNDDNDWSFVMIWIIGVKVSVFVSASPISLNGHIMLIRHAIVFDK